MALKDYFNNKGKESASFTGGKAGAGGYKKAPKQVFNGKQKSQTKLKKYSMKVKKKLH